jgi:hypothetical protein
MWFFFFSLSLFFAPILLFHTKTRISTIPKRREEKNPEITHTFANKNSFLKNKYAYIYIKSYLYLLFLHSSK